VPLRNVFEHFGVRLLLIVVILIVIGLLFVVGVAQKRAARARMISANLLITYVVFMLALIVGELFFRYTYAESDGLPTLASQNWLDRYWQDNALGYRDPEPMFDAWMDKTTVIAVGDSLTAGWGIENPEDRWTNVLHSRLDADYVVINLGEPATSTPDELQNLREYPLQNPDIVIWQYTLNDIENAALSIGQNPDLNPLAAMPSWTADSYLGNFLYWRLAGTAARGGDVYADWLHRMYDTPMVWDIHRAQIEAVIDHIEGTGARLIPVVFPDMPAPFASIAYVDRVAQVFEARGYPTLRLFDQAEAMPYLERVVSVRDAHPSAAFSRVVADAIYQQYFSDAQ